MRATSKRHLAIALAALALVVVLSAIARRADAPTSGEAFYAAGAVLFVWVVVRLVVTVLTADAAGRRHALHALVVTAGIPALVFTPLAIEAEPDELTPLVIAALAWIALAMAWTSFAVARFMHRAAAQAPPAPDVAHAEVAQGHRAHPHGARPA